MNLQERVQNINNKIAKTNRASQDSLAKAELYKQQLLEAITEFKDKYGISLPTDFDSEDTLKVIKDLYNTEYKRIEEECEKAEEVNRLIQEGKIAEAKSLLGYSDPVEDNEDVDDSSDEEVTGVVDTTSNVTTKDELTVIDGFDDFEEEGEEFEQAPKQTSKEDELVVKGVSSFAFDDEEDFVEDSAPTLEDTSTDKTPDGYKILGKYNEKFIIAYDEEDDPIFWKKSGNYFSLGVDTTNNKKYIGYNQKGEYVYLISVENLKDSHVAVDTGVDSFFDDDF